MTIYTECKADTALLNAILSIPKRDIIHEIKGKFEVCKSLERKKNSKGMIDEDPATVQPVYLKKLVLKQDLPQLGLKRLYDQSKGNHVIVLCPRLEEWILRAAEESNIRVQDYGLPNNPSSLHRLLEHEVDNFIKLVNGLKESNRLKNLKRLLEGKR